MRTAEQQAAVAAEREACALIAEQNGADEVAALIRARSTGLAVVSSESGDEHWETEGDAAGNDD